MSTYITAVVAGEYHEVLDTYEGKYGTIPLGHYCRQSLVEHLDRDEIVLLTKQGFEFFEEAFGYPYPFEKYDQLYVPEYNMGAMENAGCVTLRDEYLPRSRQDKAFYEFRCSVILHEMAHMWFGDLVTMRWWDDLWLNESFAEWACYHAAVEDTAFTESWTGFTNARKNWALRQDQLPSTHPVAADNYDLEAVEVELRHDHLRQGRQRAQAAGRLGRARQLPRRSEAVLPRPRVRQRPVRRPARRPRAARPAASSSELGRRVAADVRRQHPLRPVRAGRRRQLLVVRRPADRDRRLPDAAPAPDRHRPLRRRGAAGWSSGAASRSTSPGDRPRSRSSSASGSPTCCCSTTATSPTPRSGSTSGRWPPSWAACRGSTTRWLARCAGARPGT